MASLSHVSNVKMALFCLSSQEGYKYELNQPRIKNIEKKIFKSYDNAK